jgi:hypothetical protein
MRGTRRWLLLGAAVIVVLLVIGVTLVARGTGGNDEEGGGDSGGAPSGPTALAGKRSETDLPVQAAKSPPPEQAFHQCPPKGDGGDPVLNTLKNRTDTATWLPASFDSLEKLAWPKAAERTHYDSWPKDVRAQIDRGNGIPVVIEGYLWGAHKQGPESNNCHATDLTDYHIWLTADPGQGRTGAIVVEATPRVLEGHPRWTIDALTRIAHNNERVRISGWTMFDPEHPDQVGKTRGTIWEIHPIMKIEVLRGGQWQDLDRLR